PEPRQVVELRFDDPVQHRVRQSCVSVHLRVYCLSVILRLTRSGAAQPVRRRAQGGRRDAVDETTEGDTRFPRAVPGRVRVPAELRGDRAELRLHVARDGTRASRESAAEGLHPKELQRDTLDRAGTVGRRCGGGGTATAGNGGGGPADRGSAGPGDGGRAGGSGGSRGSPLRAEGAGRLDDR